MEQCRLTITTVADGKENSIIRQGEMELFPLSATVCYSEECAMIRLRIESGGVSIERQGDYFLNLHLRQGEKTQGMIGISGSEGDMEVFTHKIAYLLNKGSALLSLHYDLLFGEEKQEIKLRLHARMNKMQ